ncbi:MAG: redoxin domain-containing protein [Bacteroidales bacterium]|nr:redoxin domain-containing protein [Bacteroidales bacterium]
MTKYFFLIISCFILWGIASCKNEGGVIKGEILNLDSPYILASYFAADSLVIDTISVGNKGKFKYPIDVDTLTTFSLYLNDYESAAVVFADEDQKLTVKGDARFSDLIRINGNDINDDLTSFKTENQELLMQRGQLLNNQREVNENDTSFNSSINRHEEMGKLNSLNHELTLKAEERIKENPTKLSSLILISNFFMNSDNPAALERVLGYLQGDVTKTAMAVSLNAYSDKLSRSAEGESMPYFQLTDDEGNRIQSSDFSGKYVLLSFISTTGIKSRETVELLKNAYDHLQRDSVEFITIYIDSESHPVEYVESDSIPWTVVAEKRSWGADIVDNYNVQYVPFNILISPDRTIQVRNIAAQGIVDEIKKSSENLIITDLE